MQDAEAGIVCVEEGSAGLARLNRPKALNALTFAMIERLEAFLHACAVNPRIHGAVLEAEGKAFCAGGDIRAIRDMAANAPDEANRFYAAEYQHNWSLACFRKPHVALIDGSVMGGGVGVSLYGSHRVAGENFRFAMPETGIGFVPDVGGSWFLPRLPGKTGLYLALTGAVCDRADAHALGLVTHCVPRERFAAIRAAMVEGEPADTVLNALHEPPGNSALAALREPIDRLFAAPSLEDLFRGLEREDGPWRDFARTTLDTLSARSPLALHLTFELHRRAATFASLKDALTLEYRVATRLIRHADFAEGVRAAVIDKDRSPKWTHASIGAVDADLVASFFAALPAGDVPLVDH
ncbi:3-hydroxyisobutyryl-CoA hydrolase [Rhodomicrobium udaipurense JA643]|uniref:3-hydroxyisobutyryl-CoA hydrolase n=1 Tax=Rhodomicrobium udaipurense TaxID=1202716 RepID=A0A8I1GF43_9HYPH|nr:enoyl-CoA hydratase/isomerase family protein [Rhodomicrobium udaipurense]KAI93442.1 3-hydroxyisobutyryl-CoA hydrolase [Rhodomicrobium udaipurense JA643]MBJ7543829.1 enoyl-CoA hydratase/isomerase family protein [Rhodomicrobium udaipurense]